jgi:hypothetical protein
MKVNINKDDYRIMAIKNRKVLEVEVLSTVTPNGIKALQQKFKGATLIRKRNFSYV